MRDNSIIKKALLLLIPMLLLVVAIDAGGTQQTSPNLFSPLPQVYQTIKNYFYQPEKVDDQQALYGALKGLVEELDDPYSEFFNPTDLKNFESSLEGEFSGVGIEISIKDKVLTVIAPLSGTPAEEAGVRSGDKILKIDGESTEGITLSEAAMKIRGEIGTIVTLTVLHKDDTQEDIPIVRGKITVVSVTSKLVDENRIGYIRLSRFDSNATLEVDKALAGFDLENLDGIILDMRNNPGGLLSAAISVSSRFVDKGVIVSTKSRISGDQNYYSSGNKIPDLPLAILINGGTASAAEITAGAIRDHNMGILIGEQSFGKGVIQQIFNYGDGSALKLTIGEYKTPNGFAVQGVGLTPDIEVGEDDDPLDVATTWIEAHAGTLMPISLGDGK
ncbi:MAG TPA: S41 family peptidase [Candidatus Acetothermia bacterium]|nr:S41 family peptidase [Candidatus Acetothermia bacterium]